MAGVIPSPRGNCVQSLQKKRDESDFLVQVFSLSRLNAKARLLAGPCFLIYFYFIELSETKMPHLAGFIFGLQLVDCGWFMDFGGLILGREGLDMRVCWSF